MLEWTKLTTMKLDPAMTLDIHNDLNYLVAVNKESSPKSLLAVWENYIDEECPRKYSFMRIRILENPNFPPSAFDYRLNDLFDWQDSNSEARGALMCMVESPVVPVDFLIQVFESGHDLFITPAEIIRRNILPLEYLVDKATQGDRMVQDELNANSLHKIYNNISTLGVNEEIQQTPKLWWPRLMGWSWIDEENWKEVVTS